MITDCAYTLLRK